jgi:hypothetical protein
MKRETQKFNLNKSTSLLTLICADAETQHTQTWTRKTSSNFIPQYVCVFVRSNLWPSASSYLDFRLS